MLPSGFQTAVASPSSVGMSSSPKTIPAIATATAAICRPGTQAMAPTAAAMPILAATVMPTAAVPRAELAIEKPSPPSIAMTSDATAATPASPPAMFDIVADDCIRHWSSSACEYRLAAWEPRLAPAAIMPRVLPSWMALNRFRPAASALRPAAVPSGRNVCWEPPSWFRLASMAALAATMAAVSPDSMA
ncbi:hypothetical protein D9M70_450240 [compost metagenome]